jgi:UPF0755 protein
MYMHPISSRIYIGGAVAVVLLLAALIVANSSAPAGFIPNTLVHVDSGASLSTVGSLLKNEHVIRSTILFRFAVAVFGSGYSATAGDYFFQTPPTVWRVAYRLVHNQEGLTPLKVTFPEGTSVRGMSVILGAALDTVSGTTSTSTSTSTSTTTAAAVPIFNVKSFLLLASTSEGYLFPDTYFFMPNVTPAAVIGTMTVTFDQKIKSLLPAITTAGHSVHDVVIMASILEKEALTDSDRRIIAGILWKRIANGQPLQVDSPFAYAFGKTSDQLTLTDLQTNSPYNTYLNKGLPVTPINNPGLEALTAAVESSSTPYWYYLSDKKGVIHYAVTYDQHLANRAKYLGK